MQDRPTAQELLRAAQDFCERDLLPALSGRVQFHARVLQNVLGILEREWEKEEGAIRSEYARLCSLLSMSEGEPDTFARLRERVTSANTELSEKIRSGEMDERFDETLDALYETVKEKLAIANPRWMKS